MEQTTSPSATAVMDAAMTEAALLVGRCWRTVALRLAEHFRVDSREALAQLDHVAQIEFDRVMEVGLSAYAGVDLVGGKELLHEALALLSRSHGFSEEFRILDVDEPAARAAGEPEWLARLCPSDGVTHLLAAFAALNGDEPLHAVAP